MGNRLGSHWANHLGSHLGNDHCQMHQMALGPEKILKTLGELPMDEAFQRESRHLGMTGSPFESFGSQIDEGQAEEILCQNY